MRKRNLLIGLSLFALASIALIGCGDSPPDPKSGPDPKAMTSKIANDPNIPAASRAEAQKRMGNQGGQ